MFWKCNNAASSQIENLLGKEDVTLQEVMNEDDVINECKVQNRELIDFLLKPEIMEELVTLTTVEPSGDMDERMRFKYPNIACELLTCDVPAINERLASDKALLTKLYAFLDSEPPLNPLLASYFSKIMGVLIAKKTEQVLDFLKEKENFINLLLKHLGTSAIMDLILKLMTQVEGVEMRQNILNWLDSQTIIQSLIALLEPDLESEKHYNVAQLLCDFIKIARDNQRNVTTERNDPDPLLNRLESPELVSTLLDNILGENKCESAIVGGIQILLGLLDVNKSCIPKFDSLNIFKTMFDDNDLEYKQKVIQNTTQTILKRLKDFQNLLIDPPKKSPISTTMGILNPPLGNTRLQIVKLFASLTSLISTNNTELAQEFVSLNTMQVLLDLFFQYPWNNFLHTQVEICIVSILRLYENDYVDDASTLLIKNVLVNCNVVQRILDAWLENDRQEAQLKGIRQGYMGHLISILNNIVDLFSASYLLSTILKENLPDVAESLNAFTESTLQETNNIRGALLGGVNPNSSNEGSDEYSDMLFTQPGLMHQQMYAQYQMQHLTPQLIETYGFHDDDFNDADDALQTIDARTGMNFDLSEGDNIQQQEMFKQICEQNINTLDDDEDQIFEDRDHTFQTVIEKRSERHDAVYGSDSDDDSPTPGEDAPMEVDPWSSTKKTEEKPSHDPWSAFESKEEEGSGWADFSSASFASFKSDLDAKREPKDSYDLLNDIVKNLPTVDFDGDSMVFEQPPEYAAAPDFENIDFTGKEEAVGEPSESMEVTPCEKEIDSTEKIGDCPDIIGSSSNIGSTADNDSCPAKGSAGVTSTGITNPSVGSPSIGNPSVGSPSIGNPSVGSPSIGNPSIGSPNIGSPSIGNPSIGSPSIGSPSIGKPSIGKPSIGKPSIGSPNIGNPSPGSPSTVNPDIDSQVDESSPGISSSPTIGGTPDVGGSPEKVGSSPESDSKDEVSGSLEKLCKIEGGDDGLASVLSDKKEQPASSEGDSKVQSESSEISITSDNPEPDKEGA